MTRRSAARRASAVLVVTTIACALGPPGALAQGPAPETVVDVRVHGNHSIPDGEVLALAGIAVGDVVAAGDLDSVTLRLEASGRFETVEVRKRYRSLTATDRIALIIVVRERPRASIRNPVVRSFARLVGQSMFLPVIRYDEGYGMSYGARSTPSASSTPSGRGVGCRCRRPGAATSGWRWKWSGHCPATWSIE